MPLTPINENHAFQIQAGTIGRHLGHAFEADLAQRINEININLTINTHARHLFVGRPEYQLISYIIDRLNITNIISVRALATGALATSEEGKQWLNINGISISRCKSDLLITFITQQRESITIGVSVKQCNNSSPTNAQLFFTTAFGFYNLLRNNGINVSNSALIALRQFCGDENYRPLDDIQYIDRTIDPRRFFWEEIDCQGRLEWESVFHQYQDDISRLLFQKAYLDDPFTPDFILHKTKRSISWDSTEVAIYSIDELISLSRNFNGFSLEPYSVRKGSYKDPVGIQHLAPRFGIIQMQRGGQAQHPTQLQFNLKAGYFYHI